MIKIFWAACIGVIGALVGGFLLLPPRRIEATRTSPTISINPFVPLSMNVEGGETQDSDVLIGHKGEPIILGKVAKPSWRAKHKLIGRACYRG